MDHSNLTVIMVLCIQFQSTVISFFLTRMMNKYIRKVKLKLENSWLINKPLDSTMLSNGLNPVKSMSMAESRTSAALGIRNM